MKPLIVVCPVSVLLKMCAGSEVYTPKRLNSAYFLLPVEWHRLLGNKPFNVKGLALLEDLHNLRYSNGIPVGPRSAIQSLSLFYRSLDIAVRANRIYFWDPNAHVSSNDSQRAALERAYAGLRHLIPDRYRDVSFRDRLEVGDLLHNPRTLAYMILHFYGAFSHCDVFSKDRLGQFTWV